MNIKSFFGFKKVQQQAFDEKGMQLVVTRIKTFPLKVVRIKSVDRDGYQAVQVEIDNGLSKKSKKPLLREIRLAKGSNDIKAGSIIKVGEVVKTGDKIQVTGITKGKGFAGVVKRWGFAGGPRTHGQSDRQRAPGSIGQGTDPGRVWKGKKMPGRMGGKTKTIKGLTVYKINEEENEILIKGLVPGGKGGLLKISKS